MQSNDHTLDFVWFCYTNRLHLSHLAAVGNEIIIQVVVILLLPVLVLPTLADQPEGDEEALAVGESNYLVKFWQDCTISVGCGIVIYVINRQSKRTSTDPYRSCAALLDISNPFSLVFSVLVRFGWFCFGLVSFGFFDHFQFGLAQYKYIEII